MIRPQIKMVGLVELRTAMRKAEAGSQKHLQVHFKEVATIVASAIAGKVTAGPTGRAAASVRARATATSASVVAGGPKAPYFPWLDFGGSVGRGHRPGEAWSGAVKRYNPKGGIWIYPTIAEMTGVIEHAASEGIGDALAEAGWERD